MEVPERMTLAKIQAQKSFKLQFISHVFKLSFPIKNDQIQKKETCHGKSGSSKSTKPKMD